MRLCRIYRSSFSQRVSFRAESKRRIVGDFEPGKISAAELVRDVLTSHDVADLTISEPTIEQVIAKIYRDGSVPGQ